MVQYLHNSNKKRTEKLKILKCSDRKMIKWIRPTHGETLYRSESEWTIVIGMDLRNITVIKKKGGQIRVLTSSSH